MRLTDRRRAQAALLGGTALLAMGIIAGAAGGTIEPKTALVSGGSMQTGETTTLTYSSGTIAPVKAVPAVKATPH
ncbi:hypothetical protein [Mycolicibacterium sp.]|uniref:hypothetical protein n=1 Tax=Mycolicibacterium sp. TaxID=2320850 RepID=UPI001A18BBFD|nr:hypothetical protein [Mycolicibacterium sp.]MBJ7339589.1 hypothetical protein [Mycolicibacterium sp.]